MSVPYDFCAARPKQVGLIVLQADETIEQDMRTLMPAHLKYMVSRVPSGTSVTPDTLQDMAGHLTNAARLLPRGADMACVAYACTSGTAEIGAARIKALVQAGVQTPHVTAPVTALIAACQHLDITRLGLLSPYIASVSDRVRSVLSASGIDVVAFASFEEAMEEKVVRISSKSIVAAAQDLGRAEEVDALFLSCTNLRTLDAVSTLESARGIPVRSSNLVLSWHMAKHADEALSPHLSFQLLTRAATPSASSR